MERPSPASWRGFFHAGPPRAARPRTVPVEAFLVGAGLINVAIYFWARRAVEHILHPAQPCPHAPKSLALFLAVWIAVAACGRSIAYF